MAQNKNENAINESTLLEKCLNFHEIPQKCSTKCLDAINKRRSIKTCPIFFSLLNET